MDRRNLAIVAFAAFIAIDQFKEAIQEFRKGKIVSGFYSCFVFALCISILLAAATR